MDIDDVISEDGTYNNPIEDPDILSSRALNRDIPTPSASPSDRLQDVLRSVDRRAAGRTRIPVQGGNYLPSVRIVPDSYHSSSSSSVASSSARSYKPQSIQATTKPDMNFSPSERAYIWRQKFKRLQASNPDIEIPDSNDPESLERMYHEAVRTNHYSSVSGTWMIYMSLGYAGVQWALGKMGFKNVDNYAFYQMEVMKRYPQLLKQLGDPGGPSIGSSWPPWMKLTVVIAIHTIVFLLITSITGDDSKAFSMQRTICSTGIMGGSSQPTAETDVAGDSAMSNIGGIFGSLLGGGNSGSGGGLGGIMGNVMKMMGGGGSSMDDIDLENPPEPAVSPEGSSRSFSNRPNPFG